MESVKGRFTQWLRIMRTQSARRVVSSLCLATLIAVLLWQTQWLYLRPGLAVLLVSQFAMPLALLYQNRRISRLLDILESEPADEETVIGWFDAQALFVRRLALVENLGRSAGFLLLAYGFWASTRLLSLAVALGVIYPVAIYLGVTRLTLKRALKDLQKQRAGMIALFQGPPEPVKPARRTAWRGR